MTNLPSTQNEEIIFQGKTIEVVRQNIKIGDKMIVREFARRSPGTRMIVVKDDQILLNKEFRIELQAWDYRLPGGKVFDSLVEYNTFLASGQDILPEATKGAVKEAKEECGITVSDIAHLATSVCGNTVVWDLFYFVVTGFTQNEGQELEVGENIETVWFSLDEAKKLALTGQMSEDRSAAVLLRYLHQSTQK